VAVEFKVEHSRSSEYMFAPENIKIKAELNGRHELPEIGWLVDSMVASGQLQPVLIGNDGGTPILYAGHSRWRAALEINKRKLTPVPFKLRCVYFKGSEHQAFMATVRENRDRNQTTAIDDAFNIAKLERYGMSLEDIAANVYHEDEKWVKERLALIELCDEGARALVNQSIKPNAAVALAKLSKDLQREALKSGEKLTPATIKRIATPFQQSGSGNTLATAPVKRKPLKTADLCAILDRYQASDWPKHILAMSVENALRTVLGQISDEIECGQ
jgi:ParB-like chromosome segregation protein Spo0J